MVDQVTAGGAVTGVISGDAKAKVASGAEKLGVWTVQAFGVGEQSLEVPVEGDPVQVLAQRAPGSILTLGLGVTMLGPFSGVICVRSQDGIGGGVIVDGVLLKGGGGYAGELGHIVVRPQGHHCVWCQKMLGGRDR